MENWIPAVRADVASKTADLRVSSSFTFNLYFGLRDMGRNSSCGGYAIYFGIVRAQHW
jgi:hypothetical protein